MSWGYVGKTYWCKFGCGKSSKKYRRFKGRKSTTYFYCDRCEKEYSNEN